MSWMPYATIGLLVIAVAENACTFRLRFRRGRRG